MNAALPNVKHLLLGRLYIIAKKPGGIDIGFLKLLLCNDFLKISRLKEVLSTVPKQC